MAYIIFVKQPNQEITVGDGDTMSSQAKPKYTTLKTILPNSLKVLLLGPNPSDPSKKLLVLGPNVIPSQSSVTNSSPSGNNPQKSKAVLVPNPEPPKQLDLGPNVSPTQNPKNNSVANENNTEQKSDTSAKKNSDNEEKVFACEECKKRYKVYKSLRKHVKDIHPGKPHLAPRKSQLKDYKYRCDECFKCFNHMRNFKLHRRRFHNEYYHIFKKHKCPLCDKQLCKKEMNSHLESTHHIEIETDYFQFSSLEDFTHWKQRIEMDTKSKFVKKSGSRKAKVKTVEYYDCHRSGVFVSKGKGKRKLKSQGSKKINAYCPAEMTVTLTSTSECVVKYIKTHVGHNNDLRYVCLTQSERHLIASKIAAKVPFDCIIKELKQSSSGDYSRLNLLTKKDLINIAYAFNLQSVAVHNRNSSKKEDLIAKFSELVHSASNADQVKLLENMLQSAVPALKSDGEKPCDTQHSPMKSIHPERPPRKRSKIGKQVDQSYSEAELMIHFQDLI